MQRVIIAFWRWIRLVLLDDRPPSSTRGCPGGVAAGALLAGKESVLLATSTSSPPGRGDRIVWLEQGACGDGEPSLLAEDALCERVRTTFAGCGARRRCPHLSADVVDAVQRCVDRHSLGRVAFSYGNVAR